MKDKYFKEIVDSLKELNKEFGNRSLCHHIALATSEYPNIENIEDKEFSFLLKKYIGEQTLGIDSQIIDFNLEYEDYGEDD